MNGRIVGVGDAHLPWADPEVLAWVYDRISAIKPDYVVQIGDLYDFYSLSNFARSLDLIKPVDEFTRAREGAETFWQEVRRAAGRNAGRIQLIGNHEARLVKRVLEKLPEAISLMSIHETFQFDDVQTQKDENEEIIIKGPHGHEIVLMHGFKKHGDHMAYNRMSTMRGHLHEGNVTVMKYRKRVLWELDCGTVANLGAPVFNYRNQKELSRWTNGLGVVDEFGPRFEIYPW